MDLRAVLKGKKGRRAKELEKKESISPPSLDSIGAPEDEAGPPRARRFSGWADDIPRTASKSKTSPNLIEQERFLTNNPATPPEEDIPTIPDIDDLQDDQLLQELAPTHAISVKLAATYKVLDNDGINKIGGGYSSSLDDLDLSLLGKCLQQVDVAEPDEEWNWDDVFAQISNEINTKKSEADLAISPYVH